MHTLDATRRRELLHILDDLEKHPELPATALGLSINLPLIPALQRLYRDLRIMLNDNEQEAWHAGLDEGREQGRQTALNPPTLETTE